MRRRLQRLAAVLAIVGLSSLISLLNRPALGAARTVDAVHLIGTGMCFGGALVALVLTVSTPRPR